MSRDDDRDTLDPDEVLPPARGPQPGASVWGALTTCRPEPRSRPHGDRAYRTWPWWRRVLHALRFNLLTLEFWLSPDGGIRAILMVVLRLLVVATAVTVAALVLLTALIPVANALQAVAYAFMMAVIYLAVASAVLVLVLRNLRR